MNSSRVLARNTLLNLIGQGAPMLVALISIPLLISGLGTERFGILALAWMAIGYFSLFDLGLGRALTQLVAEKLGSGQEDEIQPLTWTALLLMLLLGCVGALLLALVSPWLVHEALNIPAELQAESLGAFRLLAFALPWVISTSGLRGVLEANQRFDLVNAIRLPMGVFTFAGPLLVLPFSQSLVPIIAVLAAGRVVAWIAHMVLCLHALPILRTGLLVRRELVLPLLRFGSWMTVSNLVSPLMVYLDRFLIGAVVSVAAVAYYVTPYEVVTKIWLITAALLGVLFPAFASSFVHEPARMLQLFDRGLRVIFLSVFPIVLLIVTFAEELLRLWLGEEFAVNGAAVLQWLAVGVFINCIGQVAYAAIQAVGRPDITGKLHLLELPVYLLGLWWFLQWFGIVGAAIIWTARVALDTGLLLAAAAYLLPSGGGVPIRRIGLLMVPALCLLGIGGVLEGTAAKWAFAGAATLLFLRFAWRRVLTPHEQVFAQRRIAAARSSFASTH